MPETWSIDRQPYRVALFGGRVCSLPLNEATHWLGRKPDHLILPPSNEQENGFQAISHGSTSFTVRSDGMIIKPGQAIAISSGDCPIVTAFNRKNGSLAVAHAGRPALTPPTCEGCGFTVIAPLLRAVEPHCADCSQIEITVTAAICGDCFRHEQPAAEPLIAPFQKRYPDAIRDGAGLDLITVITHECVGRGVRAEHITHDQLCTKEHADLASKRGGDGPRVRNLTLVVYDH